MSEATALPAWPVNKAADAVALLARALGWGLPSDISAPPPPEGLSAAAPEGGPSSLHDYMNLVTSTFGLEAEFVSVRFRELSTCVGSVAPGLILLPGPAEGLLAVLHCKGNRLAIIAPDGSRHSIAKDLVVAALSGPKIAQLQPLAERLVNAAEIKSAARRRVALNAVVGQQCDGAISVGWLLRLGAARPLLQHASGMRLPRLLKGFAATHLLQYGGGLLMTYIAGSSALAGRIDTGWLVAGVLLLASLVPLQFIESWMLGRISIAVGVIVRQRLLWGALRLPLEMARQHGFGDFIGQTIESESVDIGLRAGGLLAIGAGIDLLGALWVMTLSSPPTALALFLWMGVSAALAWRYYRARLGWTDARFDLTGELLEKMLGHRTRLVQQPPATWHRREDQSLLNYEGRSRTFDAWTVALWSGVPFGWMLLGFGTLAPVWLHAQPEEARLALGIWGVLLGFRAFGRLSTGLTHLIGAAIALRRCRHLLRSAAAQEPQPLIAAAPSIEPPAVALEARNITVRYGDVGTPVLRGLTMNLCAGQRLLVQGASGSGKSTLAAALTGLAPIDSGQILLGGLDLTTLGWQRWRRLVASAPQFHENHLFSQTLAFNLLIGRAWPPTSNDLDEAVQVCEELGLGPLLQRMPSGLFQYVGETGWQLSHGEKSRVYIARTLLQRSKVVLLDESFAALDPQTMARALECVLRRAPTLVVIAHP